MALNKSLHLNSACDSLPMNVLAEKPRHLERSGLRLLTHNMFSTLMTGFPVSLYILFQLDYLIQLSDSSPFCLFFLYQDDEANATTERKFSSWIVPLLKVFMFKSRCCVSSGRTHFAWLRGLSALSSALVSPFHDSGKLRIVKQKELHVQSLFNLKIITLQILLAR